MGYNRFVGMRCSEHRTYVLCTFILLILCVCIVDGFRLEKVMDEGRLFMDEVVDCLKRRMGDDKETCIRPLVITAISYMILIGGFFLKVPQILKILRARSARGLSEMYLISEFAASSLAIAYNVRQGVAIMLWGEMLFIGIQNAIVYALYLRYSPRNERTLTMATRIANFGWIFTLAYTITTVQGIPNEAVAIMGISPAIFSILSKIPQIRQNYQQGHTGHLSLVTLSMTAGGNAARLITVLEPKGDSILAISAAIAFVANSIPCLQILAYWNVTKRALARDKTQ